MFALSFGKDNRFLTSVSVRLKYLWSSIKAAPRQLTLRYRFFTICHFLVISCSFSWPLTVPLAVSASMGSLPRHKEFLAVVSAAWNAHAYEYCLFSKYRHIDRKSSLEEFQKIFFWAWHMETAKSCGGGSRAFGCSGVQVQLWVLSSRSRVLQADVQPWTRCVWQGSSGQPLRCSAGLEFNLGEGEAVCNSERWNPIGVVSLESLKASNNLN